MSALMLAGKELAASLRKAAAERAGDLAAAGCTPRLAVVTATDDDASAWYVRSIAKAAGNTGITCDVIDLGPTAGADLIRTELDRLSADPAVHGIMLQTPLPKGLHVADLAEHIHPSRDIDGINPTSLGRLTAGLPAFAPATAEAVLLLLQHHNIPLAGRHAVIVGRSPVVGKPAAQLLLAEHATVTICHSRTADLAAVTRTADVLVAAAGRAGLITPAHVTPGTVVIDVGTNPTPDGGLVGDVAPEVAETVAAMTPVPGGVGPVTTALLLQHTIEAAEQTAR